MPYKLDPRQLYRMPTHFGPSLGPRQGPDGRKFECRDNPKVTTVSVSFLTNHEQLDDLLPENFAVEGEPVVTVAVSYIKEIEWLAGRGYNVLGVTWPAAFRGKRDEVTGSFLAVLWENLTDPIITGREELGYSKIYCEIPEPHVYAGTTHCTASWLGFKFLDFSVRNCEQVDPATLPAPVGDGILHYKYMPRTEQWGSADAAYAVLTPASTPNRRVVEASVGEGAIKFQQAAWEDLPTMYPIVNAFAALEVKEIRRASIVKTIGGKDLSDQRVLE